MINGYLQYLQYEKNYSSHTVLSYRTDLSQFLAFIDNDALQFDPSGVQPVMIQQWVMQQMQDGLSSRSIARKISSLKSFWRYLLRRSLATTDPTLKILIPKTKKPLPVFFKHKELMSVIDDPFVPGNFERQRDLLILELFYMTGMRLSELISLQDADVYFASGELRVTGKRNKQRVLPLNAGLCERLLQYVHFRDAQIERNSTHFFVRKNGLAMYSRQVYNIVHRMMAPVSTLSKLSPHVIRHSFATEMLNGGADINAVKELLGHSSLAATQVYTHTGFDALYNIYKQAHPRAK